jgi:prepilin-type N-terminal cleavage/methylation domain-containing protein
MRLTAKKGFTLIELLIVVVIIGILAAIAIPKFATTKEKAYVASMKTDLRNLATAEEAYFSSYNTYFSGTASNVAGTVTPLDNYVPSTGNTITITGADSTWQAGATNSFTAKLCGVKVGGGFPATVNSVSVVTDGSPVCQP